MRIQRRELRKSDIDKLNEECIFEYQIEDSKLVALGLHALQHRGQEGCGLCLMMEKIITQKKAGLVGDHFTKSGNWKLAR